jgi:hypothetical protein
MGVKRKLSKRARRYIGAAIATGVTTFVAMSAISSAEAEACTLRDATEWQLALNDTSAEQSPQYIRAVTEAFLIACPDRPEFFEASRIAGMAAADMSDAAAAARHFKNAGRLSSVQAQFYAIGSFLAAGDSKTAWRERDRMVESWRRRLERHPKVSVSAEPLKDGMIYQIYFSEPDTENGTHAAWVAVPFGAGWPASLSFSSDRMRMAFRKTLTGGEAEAFRYVDLNRCQGRRTLGRIEKTLSTTEFDETARASLTAYLAKPDIPNNRAGIEICAWPERLLPGPPR